MNSENNIHAYGKLIEVLKVDSNGTQTVKMEFTCDRCSGNGQLEYLKHVDNGLCYKCNGSKVSTKTVKIYTDEQWSKLEARREVKRKKDLEAAKLIQEENAKFEAEEERKRQEKVTYYKELNKEFFQTLKGYMKPVKMDKWTQDFMKSIISFKDENDIKNLSNRQKDTLCEIVGKSQGRKNSKAYNKAAKDIASKMDYEYLTDNEMTNEIFG